MKLLHKAPDVYFVEEDFPDLACDECFDELVCISETLSPKAIKNAYAKGIFPWFKKDGAFFWFCPDPRMIIDKKHFKISKSLKRVLKKSIFDVHFNTDFDAVIKNCAHIKRNEETWIGQEFINAYSELSKQDGAISVESYQNNELVGGFYGIFVGNVFVGESMFHKVSDASKAAFAVFASLLFDFDENAIIDAQVPSRHMEQMGGFEISRSTYLAYLQNQSSSFAKRFLSACNQTKTIGSKH